MRVTKHKKKTRGQLEHAHMDLHMGFHNFELQVFVD